MTRVHRSAIATLTSFICGSVITIALLSLMGLMQYQDAEAEAIRERVIACSQMGDMCGRK